MVRTSIDDANDANDAVEETETRTYASTELRVSSFFFFSFFIVVIIIIIQVLAYEGFGAMTLEKTTASSTVTAVIVSPERRSQFSAYRKRA